MHSRKTSIWAALIVLSVLFTAGCGTDGGVGNEPHNLRDTTYYLAIETTQWTEPAGIGIIIGSYVPDFLLDITEIDGDTLRVLGGVAAGSDDDIHQNLCQPTIDFGAGTLAGNTFTLGPVDYPLTVSGYAVTIHDLTLTGTVTPDATAYTLGTFTGVLDAREFQEFFGTDADGVCELLDTVGAACEPCPQDTTDYCLSVKAEALVSTELPGLDVTPLDVEQIDPTCATAIDPDPELDARVVTFEADLISNGYSLFAPIQSRTTYLIDIYGNVVQQWQSSYFPGQSVYLLDNGHLLRTGSTQNQNFNPGGGGGVVEEFDVDGDIIWTYEYSSTQVCLHHDIERLPNGNILMIAWETKTQTEAIAAGRNPATMTVNELWPDHVIEVRPTYPSGGIIVWEWHAWDHLVQEYDATKANHGVVADHPELLNINFVGPSTGPGPGGGGAGADLHHINGIHYNAELDQILLSFHTTSEIMIIDHSTTTAEAAGHTGGNSGRGGDFLYRWGNPQVYNAGTVANQQLFGQHNAEWIADGLPGAGNVLLFNNGMSRNWSSADELVLPDPVAYVYPLAAGDTYDPVSAIWTYSAPNPSDFYSAMISSAQRLPNGNTLICNGQTGDFFEVTADGQEAWRYESGVAPVFRVRRYTPDYGGITALGL